MPLTEDKEKPSRTYPKSITASIEATTQEMVTIATLKEAIGNYLQLDDVYEYDDDMSYYCVILGRLKISLIKRRGILDSDRKTLLKLTINKEGYTEDEQA